MARGYFRLTQLERFQTQFKLTSVGLALIASACSGDISGSDPAQPTTNDPTATDSPIASDNPLIAPTQFSCDSTAAPTSPPWRRLNRVQYENTLRDLLQFVLADTAEAMSVFGVLQASVDSVPADERLRVPEDLHGSYRRLDQDVSQNHVDNWYATAVTAGKQLTTPERISTVVGPCATDADPSNDAQCVDDFIVRFGQRVLRAPLTTEDVAFYRGFYGNVTSFDPEAMADVIGGLLSAPRFLYQVEHGTDVVEGGRNALNAFELASRLSYHFWDTMPDEQLWQAAASGALLDETTYQAEVDRLLSDPRAAASTREFFRDFTKLDDLPPLDEQNDNPVYQTFAGADLPDATLRDNMIGEALDLLDYYTWGAEGGLRGVFTGDLLFPKTSDLASIYGVEPISGAQPIALGSAERPGLLTRAAFLATGTANTRPILKGVFIRTNILCDRIPAPPDNAAANPPQLSDSLSTRQVVQALTEEQGTACAACHKTIINPLGFATENFDSLGRSRAVQTLFDASGAMIGTAAIDTQVQPFVTPDDETVVHNASELMNVIMDSGKVEACFARHYFRYSFGRWENVQADGCALEQMRTTLAETGSIAEMLRQSVSLPEFKQRRFE